MISPKNVNLEEDESFLIFDIIVIDSVSEK